MKKKLLRYFSVALAILLTVFLSVNIRNLQEYKASTGSAAFNATEFANVFWTENLPQSIEKAPEATELIRLLDENPDQAFKQYGRKLGLSRTCYFMLRGSGTVWSVDDEHLTVLLNNRDTIRLATAFIFGNAIRDGSGQVDINQFINMTDFNKVSVAINKLVKEKIVSRLKRLAETGKQIEFAGVAELREDQAIPGSFTIIPVKAMISDGKTE
ncbi:DUF2291 domain-containing protein [Gaoshiqia sp. Z1-71]|uniref:DUF2291 domain-containing protein n=1 Tax=Gaoshiqia hydrogeniformans TaxID=3290090 RepID=UPI003BF85F69